MKHLESGENVTIEVFENLKFTIGKIVQGGMSMIYQLIPYDHRFSEKAAKIIHHTVDQKLFKKEAENWFKLGEHDNIARALWYGIWDGECCIIMDWYVGDLYSLNPLSLSFPEIYNVINSIITGLDYAFQKLDMIHQDIKPSNILIDIKNKPRIADFGLALVGKPTLMSSIDLTRPLLTKETISFGQIGGTLYYMAPEIILHKTTPSIVTDIYSLGVTLFEWLTGTHPYDEFSKGFQTSHLNNVLHSSKSIADPQIETLMQLIKSCLELNPNKRPHSYSELLNELQGRCVRFTKTLPIDYSPHEVTKLVLFYRTEGKYEKAEQLLDEALKRHPQDPLLFNTYAQLKLYENKIQDAIVLFQKGYESLCLTKGMYKEKPFVDPVMNLAKLFIINLDYELANTVLGSCWEWSAQGKNETFLYYEELGWYLLYNGHPQNAGDILLNLSKSKKLDKYAVRWFTLSIFFANVMRLLAPRLAEMWLNIKDRLEMSDIIAMLLCALFSPSTIRRNIWIAVEKDPNNNLANISKQHNLKPDWYKTDEPDNAMLLAGLLDLIITGGVYSDKYKSLRIS